MQVSVLLISHNGARWLPAVVAGVEQQTRRPERLVAIDTGSRDESVSILRRSGIWDVHKIASSPSYAEAVREGLSRLPPTPPGETEWIWLLHDDAAPEARALERLLSAAADHPEAAIFGPKLREWPSLRRLLEIGVTISGTGRRETGLERGEYDQGQHDERRVVLAVNTAGMMVRRDVLEALGIDPQLRFFGNDIDFGWRAARAGHPTMVVPDAVVFHAEAAHRGQRKSQQAAYHHRHARFAAMYTLVVNGSGIGLGFRVLRLLLGSVLRAVGFLLVRAPVEAYDELAALVSLLARPRMVLAARRARARTHLVPAKDVAPLLAPGWLPYRHGLDFVTDVSRAAVDAARESVGGRTIRSADLMGEDDTSSMDEPGLFGLLLRSRRFWLVVGSVVLAMVAARGLLTGGALQGGALLPVPSHVGHWWSTYLEGNHRLGTGTSASAPPYLLPLGLVGLLTFGHPGWLVSALFLLSVPLTALSALHFFRRLVPGGTAPLVGAVGYALLPVVSGAVGQGRLGTVTGALLLPWVAASALGLWQLNRDRRWRAVWRTAIGAGLLCAFVPAAWLLFAALAVVVVVTGLVRDHAHWRTVGWWSGPVVIVVAVPVLLLPWSFEVLGTPGAWLVEAGRAGALPVLPSFTDLVTARAGGPGTASLWPGLGLLLAGLLAGARSDTRRRVVAAWTVSAVAALLLALEVRETVRLPGVDGGFRTYPGFLLVVLYGGLVTAAVLAGDGLLAKLRGEKLSWRQPVAALALAAAALGVLAGTLFWVVDGYSGPLHRARVGGVPGYMTELALDDPASGVLLLQGNRSVGVTYQVLRNGSPRLGDDAVLALTPPDPELTSLVGRLLGDPDVDDSGALATYGVAYVYAPGPVSTQISGNLDAASGFSRASAAAGDAAWRLQRTASDTSMDHRDAYGRTELLILQFLAIVSGIVLAMPTQRRIR